ncbi:hypothetical protein KSP39_PZI023498 [Platanthera zijinensis]|uniref:Uncharacterized protein n=1 Tax=Platanthera zijinensis TaxID=2320716 RepID=A0AAP0ASA9_9ASPA
MSGKEAAAVKMLKKAMLKAKPHEAHEIGMLLVEMLIYKDFDRKVQASPPDQVNSMREPHPLEGSKMTPIGPGDKTKCARPARARTGVLRNQASHAAIPGAHEQHAGAWACSRNQPSHAASPGARIACVAGLHSRGRPCPHPPPPPPPALVGVAQPSGADAVQPSSFDVALPSVVDAALPSVAGAPPLSAAIKASDLQRH